MFVCKETALQNRNLWSDRFFPVESDHSDDEDPRSKFEREDGRLTVLRSFSSDNNKKKMVRASVCDVSGATSPSCEVTRAIRNVHDQPESVRTRPATVNLLRQVNGVKTVKFWGEHSNS